MKYFARFAPALMLALSFFVGPTWAQNPGASSDAQPSSPILSEHEAFFESKIRPLLVAHCYECHSRDSGESSGGLLLDDAQSLLRGGVSGAAIVAGDPDASLMIKAVRYEDSAYEMPPTGKLDSADIELLQQWVGMGAPDPRQPVSPEPVKRSPMEIDPRSHWAFNVPARFRGDLVIGPGDRDVIDSIARHVANDSGIVISEPCDDQQLVRRLYHDLTGLPPTIDQVTQFVSSDRLDKVERLVDALLASPEFAERFARHWMDVARYADTIGYALAGKDRRLAGSDRYRDWLIRAFGNDVPYDQMIRLQLAADRIDPENSSGDLDAMGFLTVGRHFLNRFDTYDDQIDVITRGLLGLTVGCARCHDHKFDPIPTADYYSLLGMIQSSESPEGGASPLALVDKPNPADSPIFVRGQPGNRGETAVRQYLTALRAPDEPRFSDGSGRFELAERIADSNNPLVARVFVNRIWMHLIGRPIIDTTSDFGVRTQRSELVAILDELSADFSEHWSVKRLIRRIAMSRIYAQSSEPGNEASISRDPDNRLAARGNRRRRDFESLRDSTLAVCNQMERLIGGPSVEIHLSAPSPRRTLYAMIDRQNLPSLFRTFDFASPDAHTPNRFFTTVPQQALFLMNHPQMGVLSRALAEQTVLTTNDAESQIIHLYQQILSRLPGEQELQACLAFITEPAADLEAPFDPRRAWRYGTTLVNPEGAVAEFRPFPVFVGGSWQDQQTLPASTEFSYASIGQENGHPGPKHAVVRRWTAPSAGTVTVSGSISHHNENGDGVELAVWIGDRRLWRERVKDRRGRFSDLSGTVSAGQCVDFVVSPGASDSFDSFSLSGQISMKVQAGGIIDGDTKRDFFGVLDDTPHQPLGRLAQLAQTLMLANEFIFVD